MPDPKPRSRRSIAELSPTSVLKPEGVKKKNEGVPVEHPRFAYPGGQPALFELRQNRSHVPEDYEPVLHASWAS